MERTNIIKRCLWTLRIISFSPILTMGVTPAAAQLTFTEIAGSAGVTTPIDSNGSSVVDFDGDGLEDLVLVGPVGAVRALVLYRNNGNGTFSDVTSSWPGLPTSGVNFSSWADLDNDGDADVVVGLSSPSELRFFRNNRIGTGVHSFTLVQTVPFPTTHPSLAAWEISTTMEISMFSWVLKGAQLVQVLRCS